MRSENLVPGVMLLLQVWIPPSEHPDLHYSSMLGLGGWGAVLRLLKCCSGGLSVFWRTPEALVLRKVWKWDCKKVLLLF